MPAECTVSGEIGNGFLPGQINRIVDPFPLFQSVMNVTESQGGADLEDTEIYRERIRQSNEGYSTAGPYEAYKYWAKMASPAIIDVEPMSPVPGVVQLWILMKNGESPTQDILDAVLEVCSDRTKRPLTDNVIVSAREEVNYDIEVLYWIDENDAARALEIQNAVHQAVADYELWQKSKLGRDIDPSELNYRIKQVGAKRVQINLPAYTKIESHQVAIAINKNVSYQGLEGERMKVNRMKDVTQIKFVDLLPESIKQDEQVIAAAKALDNELQTIIEATRKLAFLETLDEQPEGDSG